MFQQLFEAVPKCALDLLPPVVFGLPLGLMLSIRRILVRNRRPTTIVVRRLMVEKKIRTDGNQLVSESDTHTDLATGIVKASGKATFDRRGHVKREETGTARLHK
jgi:hypothetical protein